jgi:molybdate transport system substrate-binding protein
VSLRVLAASSLTEAFAVEAQDFQAANGGVKVEFAFDASSNLARQVDNGGPGDALATADEQTMGAVVKAGHAATPPVVIARNELEIVVKAGNPQHVNGLADLARPDVKFALCAPQVPCGRLGAAALHKSGVDAKPVSLEEDVKAVVTKVALGEVDAGVVYSTDVRAAGPQLEGVPVAHAEDGDLLAVYPVTVLTGSKHAAEARAWVEYLLSPAGQRVLRDHGFRVG